jgi:S-adenosylmethionine decarboxylase
MDVFEHFIREDENIYAGNHLIVDMWGVINHTCHASILNCFAKAAEDAGATVLFKHCHDFGEGCGTTGVIVLSESHVAWHGWTEVNLITVDIFMCGVAKPELTIPRMKEFWQPKLVEINPLKRGNVTAQKLPPHLAHLLT